MTAFDAAEVAGDHEEAVRRLYLRRLRDYTWFGVGGSRAFRSQAPVTSPCLRDELRARV